MLRFFSILLVALSIALLGACSPASSPTEAPPDALALINEAANNIRSAKTFRISVAQTGPNYKIVTSYATVFFRSAKAQYVSPGVMEATIRVIAGAIPIQVDVFSQGPDQWYRAIWTGNHWVNQMFAEGFNPETLIAEKTGFESAVKAMIDLKYVNQEQLESGVQTDHLVATANGPDVAALLGGLIEPVGIVNVDTYIDRETKYPARFIITEHDSPFAVTPEAGQEAEPVVWTIDIYDIDAAPDISTPEAYTPTVEATSPVSATELASGDATAVSTAEATASATTLPVTPEASAEATAEATEMMTEVATEAAS
ncbi:MAG: hypothetical protein GC204_01925 [Chloroflexi bacterium]|nr:hypothetical protein [Chloroflexota bacterium]